MTAINLIFEVVAQPLSGIGWKPDITRGHRIVTRKYSVLLSARSMYGTSTCYKYMQSRAASSRVVYIYSPIELCVSVRACVWSTIVQPTPSHCVVALSESIVTLTNDNIFDSLKFNFRIKFDMNENIILIEFSAPTLWVLKCKYTKRKFKYHPVGRSVQTPHRTGSIDAHVVHALVFYFCFYIYTFLVVVSFAALRVALVFVLPSLVVTASRHRRIASAAVRG